MIKEISTYGALLLTAMVVIRATTMEKESKAEIRSLYERSADISYINHNIDFRDNYNHYNDLLALSTKTRTIEPISHNNPYGANKDQAPASIEIAEFSIPEELNMLAVTNEIVTENGLSLDRESTINSSLSLLFPRQRIKPKPAPAQFQH